MHEPYTLAKRYIVQFISGRISSASAKMYNLYPENHSSLGSGAPEKLKEVTGKSF